MRSSLTTFQEHHAPEVESKDESWFFEQLKQHCSEVKPHGKDFLIVCPFHDDSSPSCGVDRLTGMFKCFSCGAAGGWNKLADTLRAEVLAVTAEERRGGETKAAMVRALSKAGIKDPNRKKRAQARRKVQPDVAPVIEPWPANVPWREVSGAFLAGLGTIRLLDMARHVIRIGLPVRDMRGYLLGYTCRAMDPEDAEPKYTPLAPDRLNRQKELPAREALFLVENVFKLRWKRVVLVEGPYDALRLWSNGVPALAIFGANNWSPQKAALIGGLGLSKVVVVGDNDRAGAEARRMLVKDLHPLVRVEGLKLPDGTKDPGAMTVDQIDWLKTKLSQ